MPLLFPKHKGAKPSKMQSLTLRGFGGGLNAVDSDIAMRPEFSKVLTNFRRTSDGSQRVRYGTDWFADTRLVTSGNIVDTEFFSNAIIAPTENGEIGAVDAVGAVTAIWSTALAALLPGSPVGWSAGLDSIDFVPFRGELILHNGVDKPITIDGDLNVTYLQDLGTGSNVNVPIGKYGCVVSNYHCIAGIPAAPTTIYVSAKGTAGTFPGDPIPNDSISVDVGAYAPEGAAEIRGIAGFRSNLIVFFAGQSLVVKLGVYNDAGVHTPEFPDTMPNFGLLGHRCIAAVTNDLRFAGLEGMSSAKRNLFGLLDSDTLSDVIEPLYRRSVGSFTDVQLLKSSFMVYDPVSHESVLYMPDGNAFVYCANERLRYKSWATDTYNDAWRCGCTSRLGRVFLVDGTRIFKQGNDVYVNEHFYADRLNDRDADWLPLHDYVEGDLARDIDTNESYLCVGDHTSGVSNFGADRGTQAFLGIPKWELWLGDEIDVEMELPWLDSQDPMKLKILRFIRIASKGTASFMVKAWVDNLYKDNDGNVVFSPALVMTFKGNDALGFGYDSPDYGGGRRSADPRLYKFPVKFKTLKIGISAGVRERLELTALSFLFARGLYRR